MTPRANPDEPPTPDEGWITRQEAATILRVSTSTIDRYARLGQLEKYRTPGRGTRYMRSEVEGLIRAAQASSAPSL